MITRLGAKSPQNRGVAKTPKDAWRPWQSPLGPRRRRRRGRAPKAQVESNARREDRGEGAERVGYGKRMSPSPPGERPRKFFDF